MCFRPAEAATSITCPSCGAACAPIFDECMECGQDLAEVKAALQEETAAPSAPAAPAAPGAPVPPAAPAVPTAQ